LERRGKIVERERRGERIKAIVEGMQKTRLHGEQEGNRPEQDPEDMDEPPRRLPLDGVAENHNGAGYSQGDIGEEQDRCHREARRLDEERKPPPPDQRAFPPAGPNKQ
jgi:hypothetical protein